MVLDRVICCFGDVDRLVERAIDLAGERIALTVPESRGWRGLLNRPLWRASSPGTDGSAAAAATSTTWGVSSDAWLPRVSCRRLGPHRPVAHRHLRPRAERRGQPGLEVARRVAELARAFASLAQYVTPALALTTSPRSGPNARRPARPRAAPTSASTAAGRSPADRRHPAHQLGLRGQLAAEDVRLAESPALADERDPRRDVSTCAMFSPESPKVIAGSRPAPPARARRRSPSGRRGRTTPPGMAIRTGAPAAHAPVRPDARGASSRRRSSRTDTAAAARRSRPPPGTPVSPKALMVETWTMRSTLAVWPHRGAARWPSRWQLPWPAASTSRSRPGSHRRGDRRRRTRRSSRDAAASSTSPMTTSQPRLAGSADASLRPMARTSVPGSRSR